MTKEHNIKLVLNETLEKYDISKNKLATTRGVRYPTIHDMCAHPHKVKQVNFITLSKIVESLNVISEEEQWDKTFNVNDVFVYKDD